MCDCLLALGPATDGGHTLFAKNSDRPRGEAQHVEWLAPRRDSSRVRTTYIEVESASAETAGALVSRPWWMWGVEHGVNEAGVAMGNATIFTTVDPRKAPPALTGMDLVRLGLERSTTAKGAVEVVIDLLERYGQGGSGHHGVDDPYWSSFLVADANDGWVVETSGRTWSTEQVGRGRAISNRTTIFEFDAAHRHPRQPVETLVDPRLRASNAVLAAEPVGVSDLKAHLRSHAGQQGYSVCMHVAPSESERSGGETRGAEDQETTASMIAELRSSGPPIAHVLMGSPCRSVYVPLRVAAPLGQPPAWERFAALTARHRHTLDGLERSLAADMGDDAEWNAEAWARVDAALGYM